MEGILAAKPVYPYGVNKHRLFILAGIGMNFLVIPTVASIKVDLTLENLSRMTTFSARLVATAAG